MASDPQSGDRCLRCGHALYRGGWMCAACGADQNAFRLTYAVNRLATAIHRLARQVGGKDPGSAP